MSFSDIRELYGLSNADKSILERKNKLYQLYRSWTERFSYDYKLQLMHEYLALRNKFPDINFTIDARIKSENSYREKVDRKIAEGNTGRIYDLFASKIIIHSVDGKTDEPTLIDACYRIEDFLNNKVKNTLTIPNKSKDYIAAPKPNGYQSIHLNRIIQTDPDDMHQSFFAETQIKTFRMREYEKSGNASHSQSYKSRMPLLRNIRSREQAEYYLPHYLLLVHDTKTNYLTVIEKDFEERFEYFFHIDFNTYLSEFHATKSE